MQEWAAGLKDEGREGVSREFQGSGGLTGSAMEPAGSQPGVVREMGSIPNSTMQDMLHTSPVSPGTASLPRLVAILQLQSKGSPQHQQRDLLSIDKSTATSPGAKSHAQPTPDLGALIIHTARDFVGTEKEGGGGRRFPVRTISSEQNVARPLKQPMVKITEDSKSHTSLRCHSPSQVRRCMHPCTRGEHSDNSDNRYTHESAKTHGIRQQPTRTVTPPPPCISYAKVPN